MATADDPIINTTTPLDWHGSIVTSLHGDALKEGHGPAVLASGKGALNHIYRVHSSVIEARRAAIQASAAGVSSKTPGQVEINPEQGAKLASAMNAALSRLVPSVEANLSSLRATRANIEKRVTAALSAPGGTTSTGVAVATEVRQYVRSLNTEQRLGWLRETIEVGDLQSAAAVLSAPPFLSGLGGKEHEQFRASAAAKFAPVEWKQLNATDSVIAHVERSSASFGEHFKKLLPRTTKHTKADDAIAKLAKGA